MTSTLRKKIATPSVEAATLGDLLDLSGATGIPACALYRVMQEGVGLHSESACDCGEN